MFKLFRKKNKKENKKENKNNVIYVFEKRIKTPQEVANEDWERLAPKIVERHRVR